MRSGRERFMLESAAIGRLFHVDRGARLELLARLGSLGFLDPRAYRVLDVVVEFTEADELEPGAVADRLGVPCPAAYLADAMLAARDNPEALGELEQLAELELTPPSPPTFASCSYADPDPLELPGDVVPGMPRGAVSFLHGAEGVGKTALALQLAIAKATGSLWLGMPTGEPGVVLMLAQELGPAELQARVLSIARHEGQNVDDLSRRLAVITEKELGGRYLNPAQDLEQLTATVKSLGAELLIVDHLSALSADELDVGQHTVIESLRRLALETGCSVLVLDHDNKAGLGERGAHAGRALKRRAAALTLWLSTERGVPFLEVGKSRYLSADPTRSRLWLRWTSLPDPWARSTLGRPVSWGYLELAPGPVTVTEKTGEQLDGRLAGLLSAVDSQWTETGALIARAIVSGAYPSTDGATVDRVVRRDLNRLATLGRVERRGGQGRRPATWKRAEQEG